MGRSLCEPFDVRRLSSSLYDDALVSEPAELWRLGIGLLLVGDVLRCFGEFSGVIMSLLILKSE